MAFSPVIVSNFLSNIMACCFSDKKASLQKPEENSIFAIFLSPDILLSKHY